MFELFAGEAFVGEDDLAGLECSLEQFGCDLAFGSVGGSGLERDRHAVGGAVAVGGMAGQLGAFDRFARLRAGHGRRVEQPQLVAEGRRQPGQVCDQARGLGCERAHAFVVTGLAGDGGDELAEATLGEAQKAAFLRAVEEDLGDSQADNPGVTDPWPASRATPFGQEIVSQHVKFGEQGVEVGRQVASLVSVALATPDCGAHRPDHSRATLNSESTS